jgi:hypothetical protein
MIRKVLILVIVLSLFAGVGGAVMYDVGKILTGGQITPSDNTGAPWFADNKYMYFGTSPVAYIRYVSATSRLTLGGKDIAIPENLIVTKSLTVSGLTTTGGLVTQGHIEQNLWLGATYSFVGDAGAGNFDMGRKTGYARMPAGPTYLNATRIADEMPLYAGGPVYGDNFVANGSMRGNGPATFEGQGKFNSIYSNTTAYIMGAIFGKGGLTIEGDSLLNKLRINTTLMVDQAAGFLSGIAVTGASTFQDVTINSTKALAVTTADKLTVGGKIVPQTQSILLLALGNASGNQWTADAAYEITAINEVHGAAGASGELCDVMHMTGTQTPLTGTSVLNARFGMSATANVVQPGGVVSSAAKTLASGDRLGTAFKQAATATGTSITVTVKRV